MTKTKNPLKMAFMGTPEFAVPTLEELIHAGHDVRVAYTQPPRPAGRGKKVRKSPVHLAAEAHGIEVRTPVRLKDPSDKIAFAALHLDVAIVVAYGLILPDAIIDAPYLGCVNIHASLLPRWRGAAPIQRAIMAGDTETGVTVMCVTPGLDQGPTLLIEKVAITPETTGATLHDALATLGARAILPALDGWSGGSLEAIPQSEEGLSYAHKLSREDGRLDWSRPAVELERLVRALSPWPGAWCELDGERLKVLSASLLDLGLLTNDPGTVVDPKLAVACGSGALRLLRLQKPGKAPMDAEAFLRGNSMLPGIVFD